MTSTAASAQSTTPADPPDPVVRVADLRVVLHRDGAPVEALRGVDLEVAPGEVLGLVGESGSGKTVLGLTLMALLPAAARPVVSGTVRIAGEDIVGTTAEHDRVVRKEHIGAVFQDPMTSLDPTMTIGAALAEVARNRAHVLELLTDVGIPDPAERLGAYPHNLSGGLRQRVMIALALARNPSLIIADEPTTALDVTVQAQILALLRRLRAERGCSVVFVTHDLGVAAELCDRVAVMYRGEIVESGPTAMVLEKPQHPYTRGLLASRIDLGTPRDRPVPSAHDADRVDDLPAIWPQVVLGDTAVELRGVERTFRSGPVWRRRSVEAVRGVDLTVRAGESLALVGESGCGKSTTMRIIAGLDTASAGTVSVFGSGRPQMVFQDAGASLTPWLSVGEMLAERVRAARRGVAAGAVAEAVHEVLDRVGLPQDIARVRATALSGGQRQRVAIARAVIVPPSVLLCDEPTSALDASLASTVLNLLGRIRRELGMTMLFVTHDLAAARIVSDRIAVMRQGRIVETGDADDLCAAPRHAYTAALLAAIPGDRLSLARTGKDRP
ncbi:ABC transporter ATP-binding protein [Curtobacterium sp. BRB10]|uniref:ABC transporter ATP-binding protein n=1 Tax=Curtobacterium sp. BRB10 TaxID=2962579 RepID=UPI002880F066|nr:ABC transporter ATP-binding protein [Curtobacterium sp. BRB10]MDT0235018.1 ABC transporter ATP-binding protein [Curtobacterium sp. BRB10]